MAPAEWLLPDWLGSPWALGLLGLVVGSFLNVVIHRLPRMLERQWWAEAGGLVGDGDSHRRVFGRELPPTLAAEAKRLDEELQSLAPLGLAMPASRCPSCGHRLRWIENIPVLSWVFLRARCAACRQPIPLRYPMVELLTAVLFAAVGWRFGGTVASLLWCAAAATLVAAALIDWDTTFLPDSLTLPLMWAGLLAAAAGWLPPLHHGHVAQPQSALAHGVERHRGGLDLRGLLVGQRRIGVHHSFGRHRDTRGETTMRWRQRVTSEGRHERHETPIGLTGATRRALAARRCDGHDHAVAFAEVLHVATHRRHRAGPFVPADRRVVGLARLVRVDVGSADSAERDVDHDALVGRDRIGELDHLDSVPTGDQCCEHVSPSIGISQ